MVQMNGMTCSRSEMEKIAVNQREKDCENMSLSLIKIKPTS